MTGYAGQCSGGRGFETTQASYGGEVDVSMTFVLSGAQDYPTLSVFPVHNSFSTGYCSGRIAVTLQYSNGNYGSLYLLGERLQQSTGVDNLQAGA